nr:hypothetical protein [uncultured Nitrosomonas sp.]
MCGIVGAVANNNIVPVLLDGLLHLEYRGYDSAGLVVACNGLQRLRTTSRVTELQKLACEKNLQALLVLHILVGRRMEPLPSVMCIHIFLEHQNLLPESPSPIME